MPRFSAKIIAITLLIWIIPSLCYGKANLPIPRHYVEDYANVINQSDKQSLNGILQELEQKTGTQYIILTIDTTKGVPIEQFAIELAEKWKLGQKGKDNGMLFVLAKNGRKWRFEVGYGLEGFITDHYCGQIGRNVMVPYLKKGEYSRGIYRANLQIVQKIAAESGVALTGMPELAPIQRKRGLPCFGIGIFPLIIFLLLISGGGRRGGMGMWLLLPFLFSGRGYSSGYGRSGSYGGGSFGGGFGGFGGGMGGGFGGGGASGGW